MRSLIVRRYISITSVNKMLNPKAMNILSKERAAYPGRASGDRLISIGLETDKGARIPFVRFDTPKRRPKKARKIRMSRQPIRGVAGTD